MTRHPPDDNLPYYWTLKELPACTNKNGYNVIFEDQPKRPLTENTYWTSNVSLVSMHLIGNDTYLGTLSYGYSISNGQVSLMNINQISHPYFQNHNFFEPH